ncbi:hypothetical protein PHET_00346 [Paragonimus heterotremus]|uniref:Uncharacterized protein n=1 Tax=Paragonimus heterotremus TaxID=100268 RepID=A0A8J4TNT9_9TREM|nr:hypothetical protein PHET_00346 [Paragonimus heterotremus]
MKTQTVSDKASSNPFGLRQFWLNSPLLTRSAPQPHSSLRQMLWICVNLQLQLSTWDWTEEKIDEYFDKYCFQSYQGRTSNPYVS